VAAAGKGCQPALMSRKSRAKLLRHFNPSPEILRRKLSRYGHWGKTWFDTAGLRLLNEWRGGSAMTIVKSGNGIGHRAFLGAGVAGTGALVSGWAVPQAGMAQDARSAPQVDFPEDPRAFGGGGAAAGAVNRS